MGMVVKKTTDPKVTSVRRANRQHPERDTADRWRGVPASAVRDGGGGLILVPSIFMTDPVTGERLSTGLAATLMARIDRLERDMSVLLGRAAPIEKPDRPMTPAPKEQSTASLAISVPGNEAEVLLPPALEPLVKIAGLLPAPSKMLNLVKMPLQTAANEDVLPLTETPLPVVLQVKDEMSMEWLFKQFHFSDMDTFRILDREFQKRNKASLATHKMSYDDIRLSRLIKKKGQTVLGLDLYFPSSDTRYMEWLAKHPSPTVSELADRLNWERICKRLVKAYSPEAIKKRNQRAAEVRKPEIKARLLLLRVAESTRFRQVDALAHDPVVARTSANQLKAWGLAFRDTADRLRRAVGMAIPDRAAKARGNEGWFFDDTEWLALRAAFPPSVDGPCLPNPANDIIEQALSASSDQVPMRELVRRYQQAGIGQ